MSNFIEIKKRADTLPTQYLQLVGVTGIEPVTV